MRNALWAEWLVARFTERSKAASIIGDLLEASVQKGTSWFWLSVARIVVSLSWRRCVGFAVAFYLGLYSLGFFQMPIYGIHAAHRPPHVWMPFFAVLTGLGIMLWMAAPYTAIRYGFRDNLSQLAVAFCALITIFFFYWWIAVVAAMCIVGGLLVLIVSLVSAERRGALLGLAVALVFGVSGGLFAMYLSARLWPAPVAEARSPLVVCLPLLTLAVLTTACSYAHRVLLEHNHRRSQAEPTA